MVHLSKTLLCMDAPQPPRQLANRIIRLLVDHLFSEDMIIDLNDYLSIRMVFRQMGGLWCSIDGGDKDQIGKLTQIVTSWGKMPGRKKLSEQGI
jgi:hypothetical protein